MPSRSFIRHKKVNGICYLTEVKETSLGRCEEHSPREKAAPKSRQQEKRREAQRRRLLALSKPEGAAREESP